MVVPGGVSMGGAVPVVGAVHVWGTAAARRAGARRGGRARAECPRPGIRPRTTARRRRFGRLRSATTPQLSVIHNFFVYLFFSKMSNVSN